MPRQKSSKIIEEINNPFEENEASPKFQLIIQAFQLYIYAFEAFKLHNLTISQTDKHKKQKDSLVNKITDNQ